MSAATKVLVVDDEDGLRTSIGMILERHGFVVVLAPNVPEALEAIHAESFDVLLSDLRMPGPGDGMTVVHAMRARHPRAITLLMSGNFDQTAAHAPLKAEEMLPKPLQMRDVVNLIQARVAHVASNRAGLELEG